MFDWCLDTHICLNIASVVQNVKHIIINDLFLTKCLLYMCQTDIYLWYNQHNGDDG